MTSHFFNFYFVSFGSFVIKTVLCAAMMLLIASCGKHNYGNDDLYGNGNTRTTRTTGKHSGSSAVSDDGWSTLDIKLDRNDNKALYKEIKEWLGTPYKYAKALKGVGSDCSGFVMMVYLAVYDKPIERNSARIFTKNCREISRDQLKEGDLVFFSGNKIGGITHVGIYLKDGYFAHASSSKGVVISSLSQRYYVNHFKCAGRVK